MKRLFKKKVWVEIKNHTELGQSIEETVENICTHNMMSYSFNFHSFALGIFFGGIIFFLIDWIFG